MAYLDTHGFPGVSTDRMIDGGVCGRERPDRVYDYGDKIIILECDEDQHQGRACLCEQTRMVNISQTYGGLPVYFIRWNPDEYEPLDDSFKEEDIARRYKLLVSILKDIQNDKMKLPNALTSALYLYYDGWNGIHEAKWEIVTEMHREV